MISATFASTESGVCPTSKHSSHVCEVGQFEKLILNNGLFLAIQDLRQLTIANRGQAYFDKYQWRNLNLNTFCSCNLGQWVWRIFATLLDTDILLKYALKVQHTSFVMSVLLIMRSLLMHSLGQWSLFVTEVNMKPPLSHNESSGCILCSHTNCWKAGAK